ncbi:MAG TPA: exopolysaccharide biosynthesis polyprenyl glycosylphosphotransferase [Nocardioides sp.]|uniref:exopolysaccharide biosynthesis polyprenyl glycosylphosphotransferase n=1 Tax=Nocardioides sp. TaxID=35761 RepID=UPI002D0DBCF0|nr:exopolysaccharide biosynthesis polyprenyl glycosylphosphotransferase [Nocardioides sp.]HQR28132.1 exopolysaccharide biosynthesis polyprenyl glycosylphosphotransferase [Nocardioides sp.]
MDEVSFGPDLMVPAPRTADAVIVPRQRRADPDGVGLGAGRGDAVALTSEVGTATPLSAPGEFDLARLPKSVMLGVEVAVATCAGLLVGVLAGLAPLYLALVVATTLAVHYYSGVEAIRPGMPRMSRLLRDAALPFSAVAVAVAFLGVPEQTLSSSGLVILTVTAAAAAASMVRHHHVGPVRLVVMGNAPSIVQLATKWAGDRRAKVVGGVLIDPDSSIPPGSDSLLSAPVVHDSDDIAAWVGARQADVVVVVPGPGVTSERVQRLGWQLEGGPAAISLLSPLAHVASHRVDAVAFADTTLIHVASSRPSVFVRFLKAAFDRVVGGLLLALVSPVLLVMVALVRLDSRGPGIFRQTRVGKDGVEFTMYKMRTMRRDAEQVKASLADRNEGAGLLFKMKHDPRITRVGGVLRKTSLDELPQLINVVKGDMSLVGPRPALPEEVAQYDARERRRLAIRPGVTGLWQVSGRSNLSWEKSVELDLRYTDNWRLVDDLGIGVRTVDAVTRSRGAY